MQFSPYELNNHCNNIKVIAIVNMKCCNKICATKNFITINLNYFNDNFDTIIYIYICIYCCIKKFTTSNILQQ